MIIGNGLIAKSFSNYEKSKQVLIFASGVSNSVEIRKSEFDREESLLRASLESHPEKLFVYISTCSILDDSVNKRPYVRHKVAMEKIIEAECSQYLIFRLSNVVGNGGNSNTILNYLVENLRNQTHIEIWTGASRNILDVEDALELMNFHLLNFKSSKIVNIANVLDFSVLKIVAAIEEEYCMNGNYTLKNAGKKVRIDLDKETLEHGSVIFSKSKDINYISLLLKKYFHK
jgi:nucleoside-diphosphate-sugar epimerase